MKPANNPIEYIPDSSSFPVTVWGNTWQETPMKILFVYPEYPDTFWSFRHALKFIGKKASFPPWGF